MIARFVLATLCFSLGVFTLAEGESTAEAMWQNIELVNASTGESFTLSGFEGKTVFVEPMATWCSNCRRQLNNVMAARSELNNLELSEEEQEYVFIALSVEGNIPNEQLAQYAEREGFDFIFAVASQDLIRKLVDEFGRSITNPPSTPHFIIKKDGSTTELEIGLESTDELITQLSAAHDEVSTSTN